MTKSIIKEILLYLGGLVLFFAIWWIIAFIIKDNTMIFPTPIQTLKETFNILSKKYVYSCLGQTLLRMVIGFLISFVMALVLGSIAGSYSNFEKVLAPTISAFKSIPTASLVFLFLVLVGAKRAPILMVILISFPILYESIVGGLKNIDKNIINASRLDSSNLFRRLFYIRLPLMLPYLMVGIASSFALSFKIEIMSEIISGSTKDGLGSAILAAQKNDPTNMIPIFSYSLIAVIVILVISILGKLIKHKFDTK